MTSRIGTTLRRMLPSPRPTETIHFHLRENGHPFVCDLARCDSPGIELHEVTR
jgi:hypothetical protein